MKANNLKFSSKRIGSLDSSWIKEMRQRDEQYRKQVASKRKAK